MKIPSSLKWKSTGKALGQGGQASVVEVTDETGEFSGTFALKGLSKGKPKQAYERFAREIEAIKRLQHSSIIQIIDHSNPTDEFQFYVMEFVEGAKSLKHVLNNGKNLYYADSQKSLQLFIQLVEAIHAWSEVGIVHRDLSLGNVLVLSDESIKVIDFGICQIGDHDTITLVDEGVGTPNYMAPECESGALDEVSVASDLYSAGKILWSVVTNMNAFARESPVFGQKSMPNMLPDSPGAWHLQHIFEKTIRRNSQDRCKTAKEALSLARRVQFLTLSGYPPLELIDKNCPICGFGTLGAGSGLHAVFGNPNPHGIISCQCDYCGFCFAINRDLRVQNLQQRQKLS
jgi:serine/threonine protein kinase